MAKTQQKKRPAQKKISGGHEMAFDKGNYILLIIGLSLVVVGFLAMYLDDKVYGIISLYISPEVIVAGYVVVIFAILRPASDTESSPGKSP